MKTHLFLLLIVLGSVFTLAFDEVPEPTSEDKSLITKILQPIFKLYNLVKEIALYTGLIFLLIAGIMLATAGGDIRKKETAKQMIAGVLIGYALILGAPELVKLLIP